MQFHRNTQHDDRRRRVLTEEVLGNSEESKGRKRKSAAARGDGGLKAAYGTREFAKSYPRTSDLIPQRAGVLALLLLVGISCIAGLEVLYLWMGDLAAMTTDGRVAAMDLDGEGSLAAWFSSLLLALGAMVSWFLYRTRRHKPDDYHGRYRVWAWLSVILMLMSIDEGSSLHEGFKELMSAATGERILGDGSLWWVAAYGLVLTLLGIRLLGQLKASRGALFCSVLSAGLFTVAVATQLGFIWPERGAEAVMLEEGCEMGGMLLLLFSLTLFARHVIFEAEGRKPERRAKPRKTDAEDAGTEKKSANPSSKTTRRSATRKTTDLTTDDEEDETPSRRRTQRKRRTTTTTGREESQRLDEAHEEDEARKLNKKQRKALRRQKQRERERGLG